MSGASSVDADGGATTEVIRSPKRALDRDQTYMRVMNHLRSEMINGCCKEEPMVFGISAPQGYGKTSLCREISEFLKEKVVVLSLDDFYYPFEQLEAIRFSKGERYYRNRGNPGTHDVDLLREVLTKLKRRD